MGKLGDKGTSFDLDALKRDEIINFLPGIFYIYEQIGDDFRLIHWNANHAKVTGYSDQELRGMNVFDFFYPSDFEVIQQGLAEILKSGRVKQVYANLRLKNGASLPFLFEGYQFFSGRRNCFLGVGLDVSSYVETRQELDHARSELYRKRRELLSFSLENAELMKFKMDLVQKLNGLQKMESAEEIRKKLKEVSNKLKLDSTKQENWEIFKLRFSEVYHEFFENLSRKHPSLSRSEMMYLAYLRIKLSSFQISSLLNVGKEAIKKKRYRLRKKMGIEEGLSLERYIEQF